VATPVTRPLRADARRNRDAILSAARAVFDAEGIYASIDGIATTAGVGNATLYRNFPTRDDLLAAVIEDVVCDLLTESADVERDLAPDDALREWLFRLAWQLRTWSGLPTCIASAIDDPDSPVQNVPTRLSNRTRDFLAKAQDGGSASGSVTHEELFQLITALAWGIDRFGDDANRARDRVALATAGVFTNG
jgi:AcrR family transcriptional regulator